MTSTAGMTTAYSTLKVDATQKLSTWIKNLSQISTMQSDVTLFLRTLQLHADGKIDFADKSVTENTRVSYPIDHIENIVRPVSSAPAAKNVIFLSADAFGVLPPVSILTPEQTQYYFLSGFTAKLAGTERGITEPTPTFSACFGQAFLELHPTKYAEELVKKMEKSGAKAYLVNTGWNGTGKRISIKDTRGIIDAILNGDIIDSSYKDNSNVQLRSSYRTDMVLIQESLILVTHMQTLLNGKKKQKIWLADSSRTSLNTKEMKLVKHWLQQDHSCKMQIA